MTIFVEKRKEWVYDIYLKLYELSGNEHLRNQINIKAGYTAELSRAVGQEQ